MNQQEEGLKIPNWLRSFIGAFCGGIVGGVFIYTYVGNVAWSLIGFAVGCLTAYILPRPIVFGQKMKEVWRGVRWISPRKRRRLEMVVLYPTPFIWGCSVVLWLPALLFLGGQEDLAEVLGLIVGLYSATVWFLLILLSFVNQPSFPAYRGMKKMAKRCNFFTAPFWALWLLWQVLKVAGKVVVSLPELAGAIMQGMSYCVKFLYRFTYHTFVLTSENCRLVAVFGAALGMLYGAVYQTSSPLIMGVMGGMVSLAISGMTWLALRVLPLPARSATI
ncbi:hypothetical protein IT398_02520 [Candidatus Nomurabacteria bacterium]|nr:hypothetical protein [Candidatus Nomurabacteria bacterium]